MPSGPDHPLAGRIPFKFKKGVGAGHFDSGSRIRPAGRTLPTPILEQEGTFFWYILNIYIINNFLKIFENLSNTTLNAVTFVLCPRLNLGI